MTGGNNNEVPLLPSNNSSKEDDGDEENVLYDTATVAEDEVTKESSTVVLVAEAKEKSMTKLADMAKVQQQRILDKLHSIENDNNNNNNNKNRSIGSTQRGSVPDQNSLALGDFLESSADNTYNYYESPVAATNSDDVGEPSDEASGNNAVVVVEGTPFVPIYKQKLFFAVVSMIILGMIATGVFTWILLSNRSDDGKSENGSNGFDNVAPTKQMDDPIMSEPPSEAPDMKSPEQPSDVVSFVPTSPTSTAPTAVIATERFALTKIYEASMTDESTCWSEKTHWLSQDIHHCDWFGVWCDFETGRVNFLDFTRNSMCGSIASEIGLLHDLVWFSVTDNKMTGSLPSELFSEDMHLLRTLYLLMNDFTGLMPTEILNIRSTLEEFDIRNTNIYGTIPSEIGLFPRMRNLNYGSTLINGTLPSEIGLLTSLMYFSIAQNNFLASTLPSELGQLESLVLFDISFSFISGTIPSEVGLLSNLRELNALYNNFEGPLPSELGSLISLKYLFMDFNPRLKQPFPEFVLQLPRIEIISFAQCELMGTLPPEIGESNLAKTVTDFNFSYNDLTGTLPSELGLMQSLRILDLRGTLFTGTIPSELGYLHNLKMLNLVYTPFLIGEIPNDICLLIDEHKLVDIFADCVICQSSCCTVCYE